MAHGSHGAPTADLPAVSPGLARYTHERLFGGVWKRPGLSLRDRSLATLAALIARQQTVSQPFYVNLALENGVTAREISEVLTHLAFYAGWPNAIAAVAAVRDVFLARGITSADLPVAAPELLPLDEPAEANRAARVQEQIGSVVPGLVEFTTDMLFRDLWLRPDLAPRDRSLVTMSALIGLGQSAQMPFHLNRAMDNGLTREEASEVITHLAFYAGWPNAMSAVAVAKDVFAARSH